jgi:hypothetical protein
MILRHNPGGEKEPGTRRERKRYELDIKTSLARAGYMWLREELVN